MPVSFVPPNRGYILYVDESGDPGLRKVRPIDQDGASEWLVIGGVLIKDTRENETLEWVRDLRRLITGAQRPDLHFRLLSEARKAVICSKVATYPLRGFVIASNKKNMKGYRNRRVEEARPSSNEWFYNFCVRLLLERVTDYVFRRTIKDYGEVRHLEVVFSNRGGMRYAQTKEYYDILHAQARSGITLLQRRVVRWEILHPHLVQAASPLLNAGVQLADVVASAFYQAADALGPVFWCADHAKALQFIMARERNRWDDYGVALQPFPPAKANLTVEQQQIFRFYGYSFH